VQRPVQRPEERGLFTQIGQGFSCRHLGEHWRSRAALTIQEQQAGRAEGAGGAHEAQIRRRMLHLAPPWPFGEQRYGLGIGEHVKGPCERNGLVGDIAVVAAERPGGRRLAGARPAHEHDRSPRLQFGHCGGAEHEQLAPGRADGGEGDRRCEPIADSLQGVPATSPRWAAASMTARSSSSRAETTSPLSLPSTSLPPHHSHAARTCSSNSSAREPAIRMRTSRPNAVTETVRCGEVVGEVTRRV